MNVLTTEYQDRLGLFQSRANRCTLLGICHGIERESLRVTQDARISLTRHPEKLGHPLTHPYITTDYSEALLEFVTPVHSLIGDSFYFLEQLHQFTFQNMDGQLLWAGSMPPRLAGDKSIPIAQYGSSNIGLLKTVYREGLWHRYGKPMQTIAGIHYNFSLPEAFWELLYPGCGNDKVGVHSAGYFSLCRNFVRYSWLLMYLFGASPTVSRTFFGGREDIIRQAGLQALDDDTLYLPYATSLRMSDMGYSNDAQSSLKICLNSLNEYVDCLFRAINTPYPPYEAIGLRNGAGKYLQLNTNLLQIENEYYSNIRPKRIARSGEKPVTALRKEGVEYVEVRCLDINPFEPLGISETDAHFLDIFLIYCALHDSAPVYDDEVAENSGNFKATVTQGRRPGLSLMHNGRPVLLQTWGKQLLDDMAPIADLLDQANNSASFTSTLEMQRARLADTSLTPSARLLDAMTTRGMGYVELMMALAAEHAEGFFARSLDDERLVYFREIAYRSIEDQVMLQAKDKMDFDQFLQAYMVAQ